MIVGQYIEIVTKHGYNERKCYKFKDCHYFLNKYFKDGMPYTMNSVGNINKESLHCNSNKARTYHDLLFLAKNHVKKKNFSIEKFNKAFRMFFYSRNITISYCPWIEDIVFRYYKYQVSELYYKTDENNDIVLGPWSKFFIDNSPKALYSKFVLKKQLKFII